MTEQKIIFRADGSSKIGLGHVSRCLALAEIISKSQPVAFAIQAPDPGLLEIIRKTTEEVIVLKAAPSSAPSFQTELDEHLTGNEIVVIDGYQFDTAYESNLKKKAQAVVSIDDIPTRHFVADVVFNFCGGLSGNDYAKEFYTLLCSGLEYVFLRAPFLKTSSAKKRFNNRLFLNMGGADPNNDTLSVLQDLVSLGYKGEIEVVIGTNYSNENSLTPLLRGNSSIHLNRGLTAAEMFSCMNSCAIAIVPPSTVALEFLSTGGLTFLHQTAGNQELMKKYLLKSELALGYETFNATDLQDQELYQRYTEAQGNIFDGSSQSRVQKVFSDLKLSSRMSLRKVGAQDREQCFAWANDPDVRKHSFSTDPIPWEDHVKWFDRKIADPNCIYFIAEIAGSPVGQIRFDFLADQEAYQISYALDHQWRGKGLGYAILLKGIQNLRSLTTPKKIVAYAQKNNIASVKAFQKAGFDSFLSKSHSDSLKFELSFIAI